MKQVILLLCLISPAIKAQNLYLSSGVTYNSTYLTVFNGKTRNLDEFRTNKIAIDFINILAELEISTKVSIKTGFYFHPEYFKFKVYGQDRWQGVTRWDIIPNEVLSRNFDFPFLVSLQRNHSGIDCNFDAGFYLGLAIFSSQPTYHIGFNSFDMGTSISLGIGSKKWQFSSYMLIGLINLWDENHLGPIEEGEKAKGFTLGLNITRVVSLKRKNTV